MEVANQRKDSTISKTLAEDVVWVLSLSLTFLPLFFFPSICIIFAYCVSPLNSYRMFEAHMDEYLDEEVEWVKQAFDVICKGWDQEASLLFVFVSERCWFLTPFLFSIGNDITAHSSYRTYTVLGFAQSGFG